MSFYYKFHKTINFNDERILDLKQKHNILQSLAKMNANINQKSGAMSPKPVAPNEGIPSDVTSVYKMQDNNLVSEKIKYYDINSSEEENDAPLKRRRKFKISTS